MKLMTYERTAYGVEPRTGAGLDGEVVDPAHGRRRARGAPDGTSSGLG